MRLYVQILPLELDENVARTLPLAHREALKGRSFAIPVQADDTFELVWNQVEERFKRNYLTPAQAAVFEIKKLQDANEFDLDLGDRVGAIFEGETDPLQRLIKVVPALIDRHFSVPVTSNLRPAQAHKRARDTIAERSRDSKRKRRNDSSREQPEPEPELPTRFLDSYHDRPLPSTEVNLRIGDRRAHRSPTDASLQYVQDTQTGLSEFPPIKDESPELGVSGHTSESIPRMSFKSPHPETYGRDFRTPNGRRNASPAVVIQKHESRLKKAPNIAHRSSISQTPRVVRHPELRAASAPIQQWCKFCGAYRRKRIRSRRPLHCDGQTPCNECVSRGRANECEPKKRRRGPPTSRLGSDQNDTSSLYSSPPGLPEQYASREPEPIRKKVSSPASPQISLVRNESAAVVQESVSPPSTAASVAQVPTKTSKQDVFKSPRPTNPEAEAQLHNLAALSDPNAATPPSAQPGTSGQDVLKVLKPGRLLSRSPSTSASILSDSESNVDGSEPGNTEVQPPKPEPRPPSAQPAPQPRARRPPVGTAPRPPSSLPTRVARSQFQTVQQQLLAASQPPLASMQQQIKFDPRTMSLSRLGRPNPLEGDSSDDESSSSSISESELRVGGST